MDRKDNPSYKRISKGEWDELHWEHDTEIYFMIQDEASVHILRQTVIEEFECAGMSGPMKACVGVA